MVPVPGRFINEELRALRQSGHHPVSWTSYATLAVSVPLMMYYSSVVIIPTLTIISFFVLLVVMRREEPTLNDVMVSVLPMLTLVLPGMCLFGILDTTLRRMQAMLLTMVFAIAVGGDTFALFAGTWIGGKKLCPQISPHKTVAGAVGGLVGKEHLSVYCATKHAVLGLTKSAALEYGAQGVRVNAVCPGVIRTPMVEAVISGTGTSLEDWSKLQPIGRFGTPSEIGEAVAWLCSDRASLVHGHALVADGGLTCA